MTQSLTMSDLAQQVADDVLFPRAVETDRGDRPLRDNLSVLADGGWYGLVAPPDLNRLPAADFPELCRSIEIIASGCLSTAFVWVQHFSALMGVSYSTRPGLREEWLEPLSTGARRAGLAVGAAVRPGPPALRATPTADGGYVFDGDADWVTGWGMVDTLYVAGRTADDTVVWALLDAEPGPALRVEPVDMLAVTATGTVRMSLHDLVVPPERVVGSMPLSAWLERDRGSLRFNGSLALGVAARCAALLGDPGFDAELAAHRTALDTASPDTMPQARAAAGELALRAAAALMVDGGSRSVLADRHAQRLYREAGFLLVFGSRPAIKAELLSRLGRAG